jgi:hypothetical protein
MRVVYTGTFPDGSQIMVERFLTDGDEVAVNVAVRGHSGETWGPPTQLTREEGW